MVQNFKNKANRKQLIQCRAAGSYGHWDSETEMIVNCTLKMLNCETLFVSLFKPNCCTKDEIAK